MRYAIGFSIENKETGEILEGIATLHGLGIFPWPLTFEEIDKKIHKAKQDNKQKDLPLILTFSLDEVKKKISEISKDNRRGDVCGEKNKWKKSKLIRKYYPIKVDSVKFPYILLKHNTSITKLTFKNADDEKNVIF